MDLIGNDNNNESTGLSETGKASHQKFLPEHLLIIKVHEIIRIQRHMVILYLNY